MPSATMSDGTRERLGLGPLVEAFEHGLAGTLWGIVLFGSTARGEATESSDLDVLVVADGLPEPFTARMRFLRGLLPQRLGGRVSLLAKTRAEFESGFPSYYLDLGLDGIILCDRDNYTEHKLDRIRRLTVSAGLTRHRIDHGFVWRWATPPAGHWRIDWSGVHGL
jgi:predicted nucleotidyltransferase